MSDITKPDLVPPVDLSSRTPNLENTEPQRVVQAVQYLNRTEFSAEHSSSYLMFLYDDASNRPVVKVVDRNSNTVLLQMPSDQVIKLAAEVRRSAREKAAASPQQQSCCGGGDTSITG
jgi:hypothetical protein